MYKKFYQKFIQANPGVQHYACHSHHYWPDVTFDAVQQCWLDSAKYVDSKWDYFFGNKVPLAQRLISEIIGVDYPEQIVFASNTHEFVSRILSCLSLKKKNRILTTDSEFYSFDRQINRLAEEQNIEIVKVPTEPFHSFERRFLEEASKNDFDLIFFSHVFFNSGYVFQGYEELLQIVHKSETLIVMDGYHGFMAVPTHLKPVQDRLFYVAGSYKYAQGGEGACFLYVPQKAAQSLRPMNTGWFAGFADLADYQSEKKQISYGDGGSKFAGATLDFTAIYRLIATLELFKKENIKVEDIHQLIKKNQKQFLNDISVIDHEIFQNHISRKNLLVYDFENHGHFLTFDLKDSKITQEIFKQLLKLKIITDSRGARLRFGFGLYQDRLHWTN
jgi:selenocysteine lyase/cysteine desulfurase